MRITVLLDHDLEGQIAFLEAGWRETGWERYLHLEFLRLRDLNMPHDATDQEIWHYVQREHFLLLTNNRNREDETPHSLYKKSKSLISRRLSFGSTVL